MNREDIIRMAREAGCPVAGIGPMTFDDKQLVSMLERFAALVASAERERLTDSAMKAAEKAVDVAIALEREACAKACEDLYSNLLDDKDIQKHWPERIRTNKIYAAAIRARGQA